MPLVPSLALLLCSSPLAPQEPQPAPAVAQPSARDRLGTPRMACPVAPVIARLPESGEAYHDFALPPGEWLIRVASEELDPFVELLLPEGPEAPTEPPGPYFGIANAARVSVTKGSRVRLHVSDAPSSAGALYAASVHPLRPRPRWRLVSSQTLELGPDFTFPTTRGPRCAAPFVATLRAGQRYRVSVRCDNAELNLRIPAQHGLPQMSGPDLIERLLALEFEDGGVKAHSEHSFIAPRDGLYLFWCWSSQADFRARATCSLESSDPAQEGLFPEGVTTSGPDFDGDEARVVLWHRPDLWLVPADPEVFVPVPSRQPAELYFSSVETQSEADFVIRSVAGVEFPVHVAAGSAESYTLTMLEGEPGIWLSSKAATGPIEFRVSVRAPGRARDSLRHKLHVLQLPAVLRGQASAGSVLSVVAQGGGCAPQIAIRGAGIMAQCTDATGFSMLATTEGIATRAGEVEVLLTAAVAEPGAIAVVATRGFEAEPVGSGVRLDLAELQWLSTPGAVALAEQGEWSDEDERLPSGTRVDWYRAPLVAGHVYRILASSDSTPELIVDAPGLAKFTAYGGVAILKPTSDGDATIGLAAPGADALGAYAVQLSDLGPEVAAPQVGVGRE